MSENFQFLQEKRDKSGCISKNDFIDCFNKNFKGSDKNRAEQIFAFLGGNGGGVSLPFFTSDALDTYLFLDKDGDGSLSYTELTNRKHQSSLKEILNLSTYISNAYDINKFWLHK